MLLCIIHSNKSCFGPLTIVIHSHFMHIITIRALSLLYFTRTHIFLLNKKFHLDYNIIITLFSTPCHLPFIRILHFTKSIACTIQFWIKREWLKINFSIYIWAWDTISYTITYHTAHNNKNLHWIQISWLQHHQHNLYIIIIPSHTLHT